MLVSPDTVKPPTLMEIALLSAASVVTRDAAWSITLDGVTSAQSTTTEPPEIPSTTMASALTPRLSAIEARKLDSNSARSGLPGWIVSRATGKVISDVIWTSSIWTSSPCRCAAASALLTRASAAARSACV